MKRHSQPILSEQRDWLPGSGPAFRRKSPISKVLQERIVRKTVRVNPEKLARLRALVGAGTDSEAIRQVIDEALAYRDALSAARRLQKRGAFAREATTLEGEAR